MKTTVNDESGFQPAKSQILRTSFSFLILLVSETLWPQQHIVFTLLFTLSSLYHLLIINRDTMYSSMRAVYETTGLGRPRLLTTLLPTALIATITVLFFPHTSDTLTNRLPPMSTASEQTSQTGIFQHDRREYYQEHRHNQHFDTNDGIASASLPLASRNTGTDAYGNAQYQRRYADKRRPVNTAPEDKLLCQKTVSRASCY